MPEQLVFPGFPVPREATDRLFFALFPPPHIAEQVHRLSLRLRDDMGLTGRPLLSSRLHVSLHMLGDHDEGISDRLIEAATDAANIVAMPPFEIALDRVMSFYSRKPSRAFVLRDSGGLAGLSALHQLLGRSMKRAGLGHRVESHFTPHMTLLYDRRLVDVRAVDEIRWTVSDFALVHSLLGQGIHNHLARWTLRG